jgi:hypothetical protein
MRLTAFCALGFLFSHFLRAQDSSTTLVDDLVKHWQISKQLSLAVAQAMPEDAYSFKAPNAEGAFGDQLGSLALVNVLACSLATGARAPERFQSAFDRPMDSTKTGIVKSLTVAYDYCIDGLKSMSDPDLFKIAVFAGRREARFDIFWQGYARAAHGLGKAETYLRSKGITPPDTGPKYEF